MNNHSSPSGRRQGRQGNEKNRLNGVYGDHLKQKREGMIRILFQNPQGIGRVNGNSRVQSSKIMKLRDALLRHNFDIVGLSEINKDWRMVPYSNTMWNMTDGWFEHKRIQTSINTKVPATSQVQFGGTMLMAMNRCAYSIIKAEEDDRRLGRWTSLLFRGRNQQKCRIICAYCPCKSTGVTSTYALQVVGLAKDKIMTCPRQQFWLDLKEYIQTCQEENERVIVMGDWNSKYDDVVNWMKLLGLVDIIQTRHATTTPPPTCNRSTLGPIDAIFASQPVTCWRGGYLAFDYLEGDHRGIWCDVPAEFLLGYNMQHPAHSQARRLKTTDPRVVKKYVTHLHQALKNQNIYTQLDQLYDTATTGLLPHDILLYEKLDNRITEAMMAAEKQCRKLKTGIVKWSPLYQKACDRVTYWQLMRRDTLGIKSNRRKIRSLRKKLGIVHTTISLQDIDKSLQTAIKNRQMCKRHAAELQLEYRHRLAKAKEAEDNIPAATHIRNLTQQENTRSLFRRIRYLERKISNLSTSRITISTPNGRQVELTKKDDVERNIIQANESKYHQTEGHGQLQTGTLLKDLGLLGTGDKAEQVLQGIYNTPRGTNRATKQFLASLKQPPGYRVVPPITFQEFCHGWKKAKERTSSSGPHFGHYKASIQHHTLSKLLYQRTLIPMITGYSPKRHREGVDVMLLKKENNTNVDKLRTIVLFDSEANMNYKHLGRRAMSAAIDLQEIATEQYSRPNRNSIDHALNRQLVMDHQLYERKPYALVSCDLKSCYDRINHTSASLALQRIGIHKAEIISMFDSIQRMTHKVRTAFGDSRRGYGGMGHKKKWKLPPQGVLQGNGSGPAIWSILSSCIFKVLQNNGHCNTITAAIRKLFITLSGFAYVDDTDLLQINNAVEEVIRHMQKKLDEWCEVIGVTGGILSPSKCWWYLVTFEYVAGRWKACSSMNDDFRLWIKDESHRRVSIKRIDTSIGMNMLGVQLAPDGNCRDHIATLRDKACKWASSVKQSNANREEVWTALHRTIPFSICYSLPAISLTKEQCGYILAPIIKTGLPIAGIVATIPIAIRSGAIQDGGLGIIDPYLYMGVSHIDTLVYHLWQRSPTGHLLDVVIDDLALELGLISPWHSDFLKKGLQYAISNTWIRHTLHFALHNDIHIHLPAPCFTPNRENDCTIMGKALESIADKKMLKSINKIRMSLKMVWMSDLMTADGRAIDNRYLKPPAPSYPHNNYNWPLKHHTSKEDWTAWRRWLKSITRNNTWILRNPLGAWTCPQENWIPYWDCFVTKTMELLYVRREDNNGWERHVIIPGRRRRNPRFYIDSIHCRTITEPPVDVHRVNIQVFRNYIEIVATAAPPQPWAEAHPATPPAVWTPFPPDKDRVLSKIKDLLQPVYLEATEQLDRLFNDFSLGTVVMVSDGSYLPTTNKAACAWLVESSCRSQWILGSINTPGANHSAYRSEMAGLMAISVLSKIMSMCLPSPTHLIVGCDGQAALNILSTRKEQIKASNKHSDLRCLIADTWASMRTKPYPVHIKGHQDRTGLTLTRLEKMNILVDRLATLTARTEQHEPQRVPILDHGLITVQYKDRCFRGDLRNTLYHCLTQDRLREYIANNLLSSPEEVHYINFQAFNSARAKMTVHINIFISKWISNTLPTGRVLQRRNHRIFNRCPRCNSWGEDKLHIVVCWDLRAKLIWDTQVNKLKALLTSLNTHLEISHFIIHGLKKFWAHPTSRDVPQPPVEWQQEQIELGWINFLTGFISNTLIQKQQDYYLAMGLRNKGYIWAAKIISHGWQTLHKLWLGRNEVLHSKDIINSLSGGTLLDLEIEKEYRLGCDGLPRSVHRWFRKPLDQLLEQTVDYKRGWLLIIRTVKESLQIAEYSIFTSSRALRRWIGLGPHE